MMRAPCRWLPIAVVAAAGCGDPVRDPGYAGKPLASFAARLVGPPSGHQPGALLQPWLRDVNGRGASGTGTKRLAPSSFPHSFAVDFPTPPGKLSESQWEPLLTTTGTMVRLPIWWIEVSSDFPLGADTGVAVSLNHWIAHSHEPVGILPFGAGGPSVQLPGGYSLIRRSCLAGQPAQLTVAPSAEVIDVVPITADDPEEAFRARCQGGR